ncbi:MAG: hypothetical protein HFE68_04025 [Erysipelotrichaceae bacterium]|nr:hypothetical protein [Erysipelotrichaceae bacterium]
MKTFAQLREQFPLFRYWGYRIETTPHQICFTYDFEIVGLAQFHPTWTIDRIHVKDFDEQDEIIQKLVFSIGMVELSSYWKITCSPVVEIMGAKLDEQQLMWWKKQYYWGLGEFFYTNGIQTDMSDFMHLKSLGNAFAHTKGTKALNGCLIPVGGGKDSIVTMELLKHLDMPQYCYIINGRKATADSARIAGFTNDSVVLVKRTLDPNMLECNRQGYLNGHTPFSALVAFSATLYAYLNNLRYVVLSNEDSANESTVAGTMINHQYSKSFQFEQDFQMYEQAYINSGVSYFSLLRGWSELQIAAEFAKHEQYHAAFRSCNAGSKEDIWCGNCPKCLFVYLILAPFLSAKQEQAIFKEDLLEKQELCDTFEKLIGYQAEKPFECVGSRDEINTAICMRIAQMNEQKQELPFLLRHYVTLPQYQQYKDRGNPYAHYFNEENLIPTPFLHLVKE